MQRAATDTANQSKAQDRIIGLSVPWATCSAVPCQRCGCGAVVPSQMPTPLDSHRYCAVLNRRAVLRAFGRTLRGPARFLNRRAVLRA